MKTFKSNEMNYKGFKKAMKKPIEIDVMKIDEEFQVETLEGTMKGKKGDYLAVGYFGELYPIDSTIFERTYDFV